MLMLAAATVQAELQPVPDLHARITDLTGTLNASQKQTLESDLAALEQRKGSQIGVLIVSTTQPEDIAQYATRVFDAWKLGRKGIDDGALLIVAKNDHRVRIEVARGLEGAIPDAAAARIIREYITPKFRDGDIYGGIHAATDTLTKLIDGEKLPAPLTPTSEPFHPPPPEFLFLFAIVGAGALRNMLSVIPRRFACFLVGGILGGAAWYIWGGLTVSLVYGLMGFLVGLIDFNDGVRYAGAGLGLYAAARIGRKLKSARLRDQYVYPGSGNYGSSSSSSSYSDSISSSSSGSSSSFSGGGGESAGGGASGSW